MRYSDKEMEMNAVLQTAARVCAAARTAPKTKGVDYVKTCVLTGEDKEALAVELERLAQTLGYGFFARDAKNLRTTQAVVLLGISEACRGLGAGCGYCHYADCADCAEKGGNCAYNGIDLGIAVGSAAAAAADCRVDSRVMFSVGRAAASLGLLGPEVRMILALPLSASGKSPFFDR